MNYDWKKSSGPNMRRRKREKPMLRIHDRVLTRHPMASTVGMSMDSDLRLVHLCHTRFSRIDRDYHRLCYWLAKISPISASSASGGVCLKRGSVTISEKFVLYLDFSAFRMVADAYRLRINVISLRSSV